MRTPRDTTLSSFWNDPINTAKFPHLKNLAMKFLSAPATSSESERLFSTAKLAVGDLRTRISQENLESNYLFTIILPFWDLDKLMA